jgi:AcrR family transcriptional regulator
MAAVPPDNRRETILAAALLLFTERGYSAVGVDEIRRASRASIGSIYHHFGDKEGVAVALFCRALRGWISATLAVGEDVPARDAIHATLQHTVAWALTNPELYRFMEETRFLAHRAARDSEVAAVLAEARGRGQTRLARFVAEGSITALPWDVAQSVIFGPAHDYLELRLAGAADTSPEEAVPLLAECAWRALAP